MPSAAQSASHPSTATNGASVPPSAALPSASLAVAPPSTPSPKRIPQPPTFPQTSTLPQSGNPTPSLPESTLHLPVASSNTAATATTVNGTVAKLPSSISLAGLRAPPSIFQNSSGAPSHSLNFQNPSESIPKLEALLATAEKRSEVWKNVEKMLGLALAQQQQRQRMTTAAQDQAQAQQARMAGTAGGAGGGANRSVQASLVALQSSNAALAAQLASNPQRLAALQDRSNRQH
ncbi:hypothetical protein BT69DRAFT_1335422 [Atractiella rhizophila]|nr:hypothetical protein BT69DRAFT_1335422 [Atractiella rhizophila]